MGSRFDYGDDPSEQPATSARRIATPAAAPEARQSVTLLAVSKTLGGRRCARRHAPASAPSARTTCRKASAKIDALADRAPRIEWHLIGPLQSNKTRQVAERFDWVHSVDRLKIAQRLSAQRPAVLPPLQVCLQVNISGEASKERRGRPAEVAEVAHAVAALPRLRLRGLMAFPSRPAIWRRSATAAPRPCASCCEQLRASGLALDTLVDGHERRLVRVGSAIFGRRDESGPSRSPRPNLGRHPAGR